MHLQTDHFVEILIFRLTLLARETPLKVHGSLRVAAPSPRGKTGGRERLAQIVLCDVTLLHGNILMVSYWIKAARNTFENTYWLK